MWEWLKSFFVRGQQMMEGRSSQWRTLRNKILKANDHCAVCGRKKNLEVHHILPFSLRPELELEPDNLIVLCADPCHFVFGHLYNWQTYNPDVVKDAIQWRNKVMERRDSSGL